MTKENANKYSEDLVLESTPLVEAWLELRWELEQVVPTADFQRDPGFPIALGVFYSKIRDRYPVKRDTQSVAAPLEMMPYVARHQFLQDGKNYPLLQLGPGVASVNFTDEYEWADFMKETEFLVESLAESYSDSEIVPALATLRYRNAHDVQYFEKDLFSYAKQNLNTSIELPEQIPGFASEKKIPTSADLAFTFDLTKPKGTGTFRLTTGKRNRDQSQILVSQMEIASGGKDCPNFLDYQEFQPWLSDAHLVAHEWFFSMIEGNLSSEYGMKERK